MWEEREGKEPWVHFHLLSRVHLQIWGNERGGWLTQATLFTV